MTRYTYGPTLPTTPASLLRTRIPSRDAEQMPDVGRDPRHHDGGLRAEGVRMRSTCARLLPRGDIPLQKLSTPVSKITPGRGNFGPPWRELLGEHLSRGVTGLTHVITAPPRRELLCSNRRWSPGHGSGQASHRGLPRLWQAVRRFPGGLPLPGPRQKVPREPRTRGVCTNQEGVSHHV
jgi:hypothetical protein